MMSPALEAELNRLGVRDVVPIASPKPKLPEPIVWMPKYKGEEPPF